MDKMFMGIAGCSKRYCSLLYEITEEIILFFDIRGRVISANNAACVKLGYDHKEICGVGIMDIFDGTFCCNDYGNIVVPDMGEDGTLTSVMYKKNLTCFDVQLRVKTWIDDMGSYIGAVSANETVLIKSAEKQLNIAKEEQKITEQIRTEFVANVTHELRTPLNGIIGHVKDLRSVGLNDNQVSSIEIIEHCADNMMKLINNILDFSKLEAGKYLLDERECQFSKFVDHIVATHIKTIDEKGLRLVLNVAKDIPEYVICDELALSRIVNNLMSNAVKFTSVGHIMFQITKASETDSYVELFFMVIDSGIGISEEEKSKLFKEFSQVDASVTRKFGGTGLGLSITKQLVEMMNGKINVDSTKGLGSTFSFNVVLKKSDKSENIDENNFTFSENVSRMEGEIEESNDFFEVNMFGSEENLSEIRKNMEKLAITIEMHSFEKAESFASNVKELVQGQDEELDRLIFRMILTVRKANYDKSVQLLEQLKEKVSQII